MPRLRRQEFPDFQSEFQRMLKGLPVIVGNMAVNFYDDRFDQEGFIDKGMEKWAPRQDKDGSKSRKSRRGLLVDTGELRRGTTFYQSGPMEVTIENPVKYAQAHNEGYKGTVTVPEHTRKSRSGKVTKVRAHTMQMNIPKRQFIGHSDFLDKRIEEHITRALDQIFNK